MASPAGIQINIGEVTVGETSTDDSTHLHTHCQENGATDWEPKYNSQAPDSTEREPKYNSQAPDSTEREPKYNSQAPDGTDNKRIKHSSGSTRSGQFSLSSPGQAVSEPNGGADGSSPPATPSLPSSSSGHKQYVSRDDTPLLDEKSALLAATLVIDAKSGRNLKFSEEELCLRQYIFYHKWYFKYLLYFFILFNLSLAFFEKPAIQGADLPHWATILLELLCLSYFLFRKLHVLRFQTVKDFFMDTKNCMVVGTILVTVIDIITYIIWINVSSPTNPVRWSRALRPLFIVNFSEAKQIRRAFRNIRRTVPDIMNVLVLFLCSILLFGLLALKLFSIRTNLVSSDGGPYFKTYFDSIWNLYVLVTTANNPDVMMPAYDSNNWFVVFFAVFIIINLYIFMSIVLASIYYNYKKNLKNEVKMAVYSKRRKLAKSFDILKVKVNGKDGVTVNRWMQMMKIVLASKSEAHLDLMMKVLDVNGDGCVYQAEFLNLSDLLRVGLTEVKDRLTFLEKVIPNVYNSVVSNFVKAIVKHKFFRYTFDLLILINAFIIAFDVDAADWFFLTVFMLEIILKLYVLGPVQFASRLWNIFDFFVIGAAVIATIAEAVAQEYSSTLDIILVLRVLRLFKLFGSIKRFRIVIQTIINIGPSILTYGGVIFVFYYFYAIIGMEIFQNKISYHGYNESATNSSNLWCGNAALQNSTFYHLKYCSNNFNNINKAFVLLFELTVVNQWHVLTSGFVFVTSKAARLYFFLFHVSCVVIVLNIFIAFILEAFILEYSLQSAPKIKTAVEMKIKQLGLDSAQKNPIKLLAPKNDEIGLVQEEQTITSTDENQANENSDDDDDDYDVGSGIVDVSLESGFKFHLKKRTRKKVEELLEQMFQSEIEEGDLGPEEINESTQIAPLTRKLTLDTVA